VKSVVRKLFPAVDFAYLSRSPLLWVYAAYLTIRYVDNWKRFPAIYFNGHVCVKIKKAKNALFEIHEKLLFERWLNGAAVTTITIQENAKLSVDKTFTLGDGIKVFVNSNAELLLKGREYESASGITANAVVMVNKYLEIGRDCIIAWDTFLTDCDWHSIDGKSATKETIIGDHTWIGVGAKVLKGAVVGRDSIITSNSVVLQGNYQDNSLISGSPAKVTKTNVVHWHREL